MAVVIAQYVEFEDILGQGEDGSVPLSVNRNHGHRIGRKELLPSKRVRIASRGRFPWYGLARTMRKLLPRSWKERGTKHSCLFTASGGVALT
jgi:hypothetical protein